MKHVIVKCSKYEMERRAFINEIVREIGMNIIGLKERECLDNQNPTS